MQSALDVHLGTQAPEAHSSLQPQSVLRTQPPSGFGPQLPSMQAGAAAVVQSQLVWHSPGGSELPSGLPPPLVEPPIVPDVELPELDPEVVVPEVDPEVVVEPEVELDVVEPDVVVPPELAPEVVVDPPDEDPVSGWQIWSAPHLLPGGQRPSGQVKVRPVAVGTSGRQAASAAARSTARPARPGLDLLPVISPSSPRDPRAHPERGGRRDGERGGEDNDERRGQSATSSPRILSTRPTADQACRSAHRF